jgi:hypothetical protein
MAGLEDALASIRTGWTRFWGQNLLFEQGIIARGGVLHIILFHSCQLAARGRSPGGHCVALLVVA